MLRKIIRRGCALILSAALLCGLSGCARPAAAPTYTLNEYLTAAPQCWSPFTRSTPEDRYIAAYTEIGLVDAAHDPTTGGAKWVFEMAESIEDVTARAQSRMQQFGCTGSAGVVWKIALNPAACWEDGTPITAQTYVESMKLLLDPDAQYAGAARFCTGAAAIAHADEYRQNRAAGETRYGDIVTGKNADGTPTLAPQYTGPDDVYVNVDRACAFFGSKTLAEEVAHYADTYECFAALEPLCGQDAYTPVTAQLRTALQEIAARYGRTDENAWLEFCVCPVGQRTELSWDEVGLVAEGDYTLYYVCAAPTSEADLYAQLAQNWIVPPEFYQKTASGGKTYASSLGTYRAYGPYKLTKVGDGGVQLARNEKWYGYADGRHQNQYQTTNIRCQIVTDSETLRTLFRQGQLDVMALDPSDTDELLTYRSSRNMLHMTTTCTQRLIFVTDRSALAALDSAHTGKSLLAYPEFREAIGLAIDRADYVRGTTVKDQPALGIFSSLYYADRSDPSAVYRHTEPARAALCAAYGAPDDAEETAAALTGYDPEHAADLFESAYAEALAAGDAAQSGTIAFRCAVDSAIPADTRTRQQERLQSYLNAATQGTPLEGRLQITLVPSDDRYRAVASGEVEMAIGAWSGAADHPYSLIRCYTDPAYALVSEQCGFDPTAQTCTILVNGADETRTFYEWGAALNAGGIYADAPEETRLAVLAGLERALLQAHCFAVLSVDANASLYSDKIRFATREYNLLSGYGGVRGIRYHYSDAEWAQYVKMQPNGLDYTAAELD